MRFLALSLLLLSACLPGPEDLVAETSVELVVTGVSPGDSLALTLLERTVRAEVGRDQESLSFFFELDPGTYDAELLLVRGDRQLCGAIELVVEDEGRALSSIDARRLAPCSPIVVDAGPDAGLVRDRRFVRVTLEVPRDDGRESFSVLEDGTYVRALGETEEIERLGDDVFDELVLLVLSERADALFDGSSECVRPDDEQGPTLERVTARGGTRATERVNIRECGDVARDIGSALLRVSYPDSDGDPDRPPPVRDRPIDDDAGPADGDAGERDTDRDGRGDAG